MPRAEAMFRTIFNLPYSHSEATGLFRVIGEYLSFYYSSSYKLEFVSVASGIDDQEMLKARIKRELESRDQFLSKTAILWRSFEELHQWMFESHAAYASKRLQGPPRKKLSPEELKSY